MSYHLHLSVWLKLKTVTTPNAGKNAEKLVHSYNAGRKANAITTIIAIVKKTVWQFLNKLNIHMLYDPAIPLLDIHLRKMKIYAPTKTCT